MIDFKNPTVWEVLGIVAGLVTVSLVVGVVLYWIAFVDCDWQCSLDEISVYLDKCEALEIYTVDECRIGAIVEFD